MMMHFWEKNGVEDVVSFHSAWMFGHWLIPALLLLSIGLWIGYMIGRAR